MPAPIPSDLPTIAQTVERRLLTYRSPITGTTAAGDISNIYWVEPGEEPDPGQTGERDIILVELEDDTSGTVVGAGRFATIDSGLEIYLRSQRVTDKRSTRRSWFIAHRNLINGLLDAMMGFFPEDQFGNALTVQGLVLEGNTTPRRTRPSETWGHTIGTYRFRYIPRISQVVG